VKAVAPCAQQDDAKRAMSQLLLERDALIHRDQRIEPTGHDVQELSIFKVRPAEFYDAQRFVTREGIPQTPWYAVVKENAHIAL